MHRSPVPPHRSPLSLDEQVAAAIAYLDDRNGPGEGADAAAQLSAVRPAPEPGQTTRVMFVDPATAEPSTSEAVFVDPVTGEIRGDLAVYGTSGSLPLRTWIDGLHRGLHLGDAGRLYSELAASWLWIVALGGLVLWAPQLTSRLRARKGRRRARREASAPRPRSPRCRGRRGGRGSRWGSRRCWSGCSSRCSGSRWRGSGDRPPAAGRRRPDAPGEGARDR